MLALLVYASTILTFIYSWPYVIFHVSGAVIFQLILLFVHIGGMPEMKIISSDPRFKEMTLNDEREIFRKYHLALRFPFASRDFSSACSTIQMSSAVLFFWALWQGMWFVALLFPLQWFTAQWLATLLNPRYFLALAAKADIRMETDAAITVGYLEDIAPKIGKVYYGFLEP